MRKSFFLAAFMLGVSFIFFSPASAALYQWVDEHGNMHITDYPKPSREPVEELNPGLSQDSQKAVQPHDEQNAAKPAAPPPAIKQTEKAVPASPAPASVSSSPTKSAASLPQPALAQQPVSITPPPAAQQASPPGMPLPLQGAIKNTSPFAVPGNEAMVINALIAGFGMIFMLAAAGLYIYFSLCMYLIASKLNVTAAWTAWVPIIQVWPFLGSAGKPCWWVILLFIPAVNMIVGIYLWMCIAENLGRNRMLALLMLLPVVNLLLLGVLAFSKKSAQEAVAA